MWKVANKLFIPQVTYRTWKYTALFQQLEACLECFLWQVCIDSFFFTRLFTWFLLVSAQMLESTSVCELLLSCILRNGASA